MLTPEISTAVVVKSTSDSARANEFFLSRDLFPNLLQLVNERADQKDIAICC